MDSSGQLRRQSLTHQVTEILIDRIRTGIYPAGSQLDPENTLAEEFGVSRATIRSAVEALAVQHLVIRKHGVGTFVSEFSQIKNPLDEAVLFQTLIADNGFTPGIRFLPSSTVAAGERLARALKLPDNAPVIRVPKVFTADDEPVIYCVNTIPYWVAGDELAARILADAAITEPIFDCYDQHFRQPITFYHSALRPEIAGHCELLGYELPADTPCLVIDEVAFNGSGQVVLHSLHTYPGNRMAFELVRHR